MGGVGQNERMREKSVVGKQRSLSLENGKAESGRNKQRMTYFVEIRAWRDEKYLRKKGWYDGVRLGKRREENNREI